MWDGPDDFRTLPDSVVLFSVVSTSDDDAAAGPGAVAVRLSCLDFDWKPIEDQVITLTGTTPADVPIGCYRIQGFEALDQEAKNSQRTNVGDISVTARFPATTVYEVIKSGIGIRSTIAWTVPFDHVAVIDLFAIFTGPETTVETLRFDIPGAVIVARELPLDAQAHEFNTNICLPQGTDIDLLARNEMGGNPIRLELNANIAPMFKPGGQCPVDPT